MPLSRGGVLTMAAAALLLLVAGALRLYGLGEAPPGIFRDELEKGYTALQLWETGRHGIPGPDGVAVSGPIPLFIETFAGHDRTSAIYQYLSAPIVGLFGLGVVTTRLVAGLAGWLTVALAGLWGWRVAGRAGALVALAVAAAHPTGIIFSRWAQQGVTALPLLLGALLLLDTAWREAGRHGRALALLAGLMLGLAAYAYDPLRLTVPLLAAGWLAIHWRDAAARRVGLLATAVLTAIWVPLAVYTLGAGSARLSRVAVGGDGAVPAVVRAYASFFDPVFWVWSGDANPRHRLPLSGFAGRGAVVLLLAVLGAAAWRWRRLDAEERRHALVALMFLLTPPLAAALTNEGNPHALRAIPLVLAAPMLASLMPRVAPWRPSIATATALLLAADLVAATAGVRALRNAPGGPWEAGVQQAMQFALAAPGRVLLAGDVPYAPYVALFAERTPPALYHEFGLAALRTRIVPPGEAVALRPGDRLVTPPHHAPTLELLARTVVVEELSPQGLVIHAP